ncbi:MAG: DNA helicase II, partial [Dechloromonas sp.]|nr:DNA helicase II [Dechloromonas sp.]
MPSSFLDEIPENLMRKLNKKAEAAASVPAYGAFGGGYAEPAAASGLHVGQSVEHAKFGVGVIVSTEGRGADARVQVNFGGAAGMKWLSLEYAKLTPV